jgi:hypothetical protein
MGRGRMALASMSDLSWFSTLEKRPDHVRATGMISIENSIRKPSYLCANPPPARIFVTVCKAEVHPSRRRRELRDVIVDRDADRLLRNTHDNTLNTLFVDPLGSTATRRASVIIEADGRPEEEDRGLLHASSAEKPLVGRILHDVRCLALLCNVLRRGVFIGACVLRSLGFAARSFRRSVGGRHGRHMAGHGDLLIGCSS